MSKDKSVSPPAWTCPVPNCKSTTTELINYDPVWRDGDIVCARCGHYVRSYDAG